MMTFERELKTRISHAQLRAAVAVNKELVLLYWQIGRDILHRQQQQGWGAKVINRLATDLQQAFPEIKGFSPKTASVAHPTAGVGGIAVRRLGHSLIPYSLEAQKPVFDCTSADGLRGAHISRARDSVDYFEPIVKRLLTVINNI
jgi:hypothetical protein